MHAQQLLVLTSGAVRARSGIEGAILSRVGARWGLGGFVVMVLSVVCGDKSCFAVLLWWSCDQTLDWIVTEIWRLWCRRIGEFIDKVLCNI